MAMSTGNGIGKGFTRLKSMDTLESETDDEYDESVPLYKTTFAGYCFKVCYHSTIIFTILLLLVAVLFGGYMVFEMQLEISQLKESLQKLQVNKTGSDSLSDKMLDELRESQSKIHATILANVSKVVEKSNLDRNSAMDHLQETMNKALADLKVRSDQLSDHDKRLRGLGDALQLVRDVIAVNFTAEVSKLTEDLKRTQSRVAGVEKVMDAIKNSTEDGVQAIQEMSRSRGGLVQDIYLLKRSNYSMTLEMTKLKKNVTEFMDGWMEANKKLLLLNSSLESCLTAIDELRAWQVASNGTHIPGAGPSSAHLRPTSSPDAVLSSMVVPSTTTSSIHILLHTTFATSGISSVVPSASSNESFMLTSITDEFFKPSSSSPTESTLESSTVIAEVTPSAVPAISSSATVPQSSEDPSVNRSVGSMIESPEQTLLDSTVHPKASIEGHKTTLSDGALSTLWSSPSVYISSGATSLLAGLDELVAPATLSTPLPSQTPFPSGTPHPAHPGQTSFTKLKSVLEAIRTNFNETDRDGDGKLSYEEFQEIPAPTSRKFFDLVDSNKDHFITIPEVDRILNLPSINNSRVTG